MTALQDTLSITRQANRILQANVEVGDTKGGMLIFADEVTHRWNVVIHGLPPPRRAIATSSGSSAATAWSGAMRSRQTRRGRPSSPPAKAQSCPAVKGAALTEEPMADEQGPPRGKSLAHVML